ncbi:MULTISPECIES: aminotransferase class I/II-fold pyridoxal phosphate-dependent enzyme [Pseudomonas]|uniref:aminotransferase class I/II-fold pyridoxal phosphate-dependent enzyme n=1 Tax=Pseudomonas TaxID=286 RepID=UPI0015DC9AC0|nr:MULTISPECIES: aminotransferase class I/II-fold pyridoxal phosphate-dependent enzyme [Pseudomonas]URD40578.1 aminotransferase class I/II-fold pyridoxal phosphate-dependent enzyme [Pseudomonas sp. BYT-5]URK95939.1 aminotransferase class I/II-fold pyridoxal phosphate-dependent enzyme [Pseudomonas sp. BYT-1]CAB5519031.1 2-amino-3-ketobutyrate coenzyme A ligase [Pseudomonas putida]CAB5528363.1 2-amino-3-ketobutyrate coenzyme A ligase [Pseudomonas putida]CAB5546192.1 2-amino-3-ketobutyrate coenzy
MGTDIGRDWMTIRRDNTTGALVTAYEEGLTGFTVASREGKRVTLQGGDTFTEFVSCSYLGLETHPALIEAARQAMVVGGLHLSSSRSAMRPIYLPQLESLLGSIYQGCGVSVFTSTSSVHLGVLPLLGSGSLKGYPIQRRVHWLLDKTAHASMQVLRGVLQQFGEVSRVQSTDPESMRAALKRCIERQETPILLIDGIGSMSGLVPIAELSCQLEQAGGYLYVDDAHGISITGRHGAGYAFDSVAHVLPSNMVLAGSMSKAFGGAGGFVVLANQRDIESIQTLANPLIFGHSIMLPMLAANVAAAKIHLSEEIAVLQQRLWKNVRLFDVVTGNRMLNAGIQSPVRGALFETEETGIKAARILRANGVLLFPVFYPIIAKGKAMLRFAISADHGESDIRQLGNALNEIIQAGLWPSGD